MRRRRDNRDHGDHGGQVPATMNMSYIDMQIGSDGNVLTKDQIRSLRQERGYCVECPGVPVRLYQKQRSKLNPLWQSKEPLSIEGVCANGICLQCHPRLDPSRRAKRDRRRSAHASGSASNGRTRNGQRPPRESHTPSQQFSSPSRQMPVAQIIDATVEAVDPPVLHNHHPPPVEQPTAPAPAAAEPTHPLPSNPTPPFVASRQHPPAAEPVAERPPQFVRRTSSRPAPDVDDDRPPQRPEFRRGSETTGAPGPAALHQPIQEPDQVAEENPNGNNSTSTVGSLEPQRDQVAEFLFDRSRQNSSRRILRQPSIANLRRSMAEEPIPIIETPPQVNYQQIVRDHQALIKDMSEAGDPNLTVDIILQLMREHPKSEEVQKFCISSLWDLSKNSNTYRGSIMSSSAPDDILFAMKNFLDSWQVQEMGCGAVWALAARKDARTIVGRAGAASRIILALVKHMRVEDLVLTALGSLRTLSSEMEVRQDLVALEAPQRVSQAMSLHRRNAAVQRDGCAFLSNSAVDVERQEVATATKEELETIVQAMAAHRREPSVLAAAAFALKNYTFMETNIRTLLSCEGAHELVEHTMNTCTDSKGQSDAIIVLDRIQNCFAEDRNLEGIVYDSMMESVQRNISSPSTVTELITTMRDNDWSDRIVAGALQALTGLVNHSHSHRARITGNILKSLVGTIGKHKNSEDVQKYGCNLLEFMANEPKNRYNILDAQGPNIIAQAMRCHRTKVAVQDAATGALKALSVEFDCWFELERSGNTSVVTEIMREHPGASRVQKNVTDILTNFSAYAETGVHIS